MTKKNSLKMLTFVAALAAFGGLQAQNVGTPSTIELDPCLNAYLAWTEAAGLDVTYAFQGLRSN